MKTTFAALLALVPVTAYCADTYDCTLTIVENINVMQVKFSNPSGVKIDFGKGVPEGMVTSTTVLNDGIFTGDYTDLGYSEESNDGDHTGTVLYTTDYRHPTQKFSFSTEIVKSLCDPNPPYTYECYLQFFDDQGQPQQFGFEQDTDAFDKTDTLKSTFQGFANAYVDTRDGSLNFSGSLYRLGFKGIQPVMYQGEGQLILDQPEKIRLDENVMTGFHNVENPSDSTQGDGKSDWLEVRCAKHGS
jgi:hypothetical protein